jgi:hypothetical protein
MCFSRPARIAVRETYLQLLRQGGPNEFPAEMESYRKLRRDTALRYNSREAASLPGRPGAPLISCNTRDSAR